MSKTVTTALYIGGKERHTEQKMAIADPAKPGVIVGQAAAATTQDVSDAVAAAKAAYPAWAALTPQKRAEKMLAALGGIAENRDDDAAILSQENGKVRFEAWVDSLVLELRWKLALSHADEVNAAKVLPPVHGAIPVETTVAYQPLGVVTIIVPFNWPVAILASCSASPNSCRRAYSMSSRASMPT
jgi:acyl-CoA reductase-like NAD-dependent aldehyde dehydrogenase